MSVTTTAPEPGSLLNLIARAAADPGVDVAKMESLLAMQERVIKAQAKHDFNASLARVAAEMEPVRRDAQNPHLGNRYARLETIDAALRPIYSSHGFSVRYGSEDAPAGSVRITCTVAHTSGHSETLGLTAPIDVMSGGRQARTGVQAIGSSVTYLRRYLLSMAFNVTMADDDDDGEASRRPRRPLPPVDKTAGNGSGDARVLDTDPDAEVRAAAAAQWVHDVGAEFAQAQSAEGIAVIERSRQRGYDRLREDYPELVLEFDAARAEARRRVAGLRDPVEEIAERGADLLSGG